MTGGTTGIDQAYEGEFKQNDSSRRQTLGTSCVMLDLNRPYTGNLMSYRNPFPTKLFASLSIAQPTRIGGGMSQGMYRASCKAHMGGG